MAQTIILVVLVAFASVCANAAIIQTGRIVVVGVGNERPMSSFAGIMDAFQDLQPCCPIPMLLNRSSTTCTNVVKGYKVNMARGYFSALQNIAVFEGDKSSNGNSFMCLMDCVFNSLNLIANSTTMGGTLDVVNITSHFESTVNNATWMDIINNATEICIPRVEALTGTKTVRYGTRVCSTKPLHFMFCLRRLLYSNCPTPSTTTSCKSQMKALVRRGPFMGLHTLIENRRTRLIAK